MRAVQKVLIAGVTIAAVAGTTGTAFAATVRELPAPAAAGPTGGPAGAPSAKSGLGGVGDLVNGLVGSGGVLSFLLPSPAGNGANFITGLMNNPAGAITGNRDSILPYGLLDGGKPQPLPSK